LLGYLAEEKERFERTVQVGLYDLEAIIQNGNGQISREDIDALEKKARFASAVIAISLMAKENYFWPS